ncbi:MAG: hypothetical protein HY753_03225 [Nitrospirae bacterium]|nr:hypothetical protein [Nitrospirota bacterium]
MKKQNSIQLTISETSGIDSFQEPVTVGVPFPEGVLSSSDGTALFKDEGDCIPLQTSIVSNWPDGSVKWLLLDFFAHRLAKSTVNYYLVYKVNNFHQHAREKMRINDEDKAISVDTGSTIFSIDRNNFIPFKSVRVSGTEMLDAQESHVVLTDGSQMELHPVVSGI